MNFLDRETTYREPFVNGITMDYEKFKKHYAKSSVIYFKKNKPIKAKLNFYYQEINWKELCLDI